MGSPKDNHNGDQPDQGLAVRPATEADASVIETVVRAAFGNDDEVHLVRALRAAGDARVELVAEIGGTVVGHVMLSAMRADFPALGLAPLSVAPAYERRGIGSALMEEALRTVRAMPVAAVFVLGDPRYYSRFGFSTSAARAFTSPYAGPHFMALVLDEAGVAGTPNVTYAPAFDAAS